MFSSIFVQRFMALPWKMSPGMRKEAYSLNGPLYAYLMRQNLHNRTRSSFMAINVLATFQNDPRKITDMREHYRWFFFFFFFWGGGAIFIKENSEVMSISMFSSTFVPNLVTLPWKMSPGMPKKVGPLNGPLCTFLMRQNLHNRTLPKS